MSKHRIDPRLKHRIDQVTRKRARVVLDHILEYGFITTEDLLNYGYNHPPRAARDVREEGIPLVTYRVTGSDGRSIAAYKLGDPDRISKHKLGGRKVLPKKLRNALYAAGGGRCAVCGHDFEARYLQVDHRVPYEIAGQAATPEDTAAFMLLCGSCQRAKSWSCEHCDNWVTKNRIDCRGCYWVDPENHTHVATDPVRRLDLTFSGDEVGDFQLLVERLKARDPDLRRAIRRIVLDTVRPKE